MEDTNKQNSAENYDESAIEFINLSKVKSFISNYWPYFLAILPVIIVILMRYQAAGLTITDDWAQKNAYDGYLSQISGQIDQQYPDLPQESRQELIKRKFDDFIRQNKEAVEQQIASISSQQRDFFQYRSGSHSYPYIGDIDSYYWLRQARNLEEKGYICDVVENGVCYDTYTVAPGRKHLDQSLHPYSIYFTYKLLKPFNPDFTLMEAQLIVPTIYAAIIAALVYIMMLRSFGILAALASSLLLSSNVVFLSRSLGSDSDIYNVFFPVLAVFFILESLRAKTARSRSIFAGLSGLSLGMYSFAWIGWWYLFDFVVIAVAANYFIAILKESLKTRIFSFKAILCSQKTRNLAFMLLPFLAASVISIGLISGFSSLEVALKGPFGFTQSKVAANPNVWPNVLTTVAEFNESSFQEIIRQSGGKWLFFSGIFGFMILIYSSLKNIKKNFIIFFLSAAVLYYVSTPRGASLEPLSYMLVFSLPLLMALFFVLRSEEEIDITFALLLFLWAISSIYAATKGVRFTLLAVPPIMIGTGITFWFFHRTLSNIASKLFRIREFIPAIALFIVFFYPVIGPVETGFNAAKNYFPSVNDQWWEELMKIRENSKPDAIINSWWDFGHWFKFISNRRVTLDGSSQNSPQLHWLGKLLLTSDEIEAKNILRMLDCGGNMAFESISRKKNSTPKSIRLLNRLLLIDKSDEAKQVLIEHNFSAQEAEQVLQYTHCDPPENFLITSEDMVGKSGVWAHFGSWNFDKAWMQKNLAKARDKEDAANLFSSEIGISKADAESYYVELSGLKSESEINAWIAPWPGYIQGPTSCRNESDAVLCPIQQGFVVVNLTEMDAFVPTSAGIKRLNLFSYTTPEGIVTRSYSGDTIGVGMVLLVNSDGSYSSIFMSPQLVNSTFTKLYYLDGHGTRYFEPFHSSSSSGFDIKVWKVNWDGMEKQIQEPKFKENMLK